MPSSKGPVVDSPARTRNHAVTNQGSDICLLQSSWKSLDIYPLANFVVKVSMAGTPYATQTFVSNFWCNFLSRKRKHARNLEQHHILFKELLKHCAARAWHLVPLDNLCPPTSFAKKEHPPKKQATQTGRGRIYGHELSKVPGRLSSPTGTTDLCVRRTPSSNGTPPTSPGHQPSVAQPLHVGLASFWRLLHPIRQAKSLRHMEADSSVPFWRSRQSELQCSGHVSTSPHQTFAHPYTHATLKKQLVSLPWICCSVVYATIWQRTSSTSQQ